MRMDTDAHAHTHVQINQYNFLILKQQQKVSFPKSYARHTKVRTSCHSDDRCSQTSIFRGKVSESPQEGSSLEDCLTPGWRIQVM